ncbi:hypothetical protein PUW24_06015 [Paenibacillus urinalis]|uniref:Uncharacterized protein n=1 Tax=Paenibacillus urinalis TaxID=521520 RepID=A0AAX3MYM7_9BACL|nr:hypothetical protein [Paenibacillus urinalis]WDH82422.1 hypothetical protein PUW23_23745 [Paenibacillus urinalis]WDH98481.1 hypothetical protein PUW24_06015 [Paenibacillus urinalis]WDI02170.1 hypothetical protein PUW25_23740 [Paenibacillus urinalis]
MTQMTSRRVMNKHYAGAVINELQKIGYPGDEAKEVFFRHYRDMKRLFGLEPNVSDFATLVDEFERSMKRKYNPQDPNQIYVGHLRDRAKKMKTVRVHLRSAPGRRIVKMGTIPKNTDGMGVIKVGSNKRK